MFNYWEYAVKPLNEGGVIQTAAKNRLSHVSNKDIRFKLHLEGQDGSRALRMVVRAVRRLRSLATAPNNV